ncbi:hypothetical protein EJD97_023746 [Solanum chilense]|uniref:Uncharacterized protein n=1 Tax=Solanum chilense TaxID=4083 RepID=A0A6N2ATQ2_SOLCI|nr:hypothetical protein EJD97_023746 [Solanum chilense]
MTDVIRSRMLSKGDDGMSCLTSSNRVCIPRAMMALPRLTSSDRVWYSRTNVVRQCVFTMGDDNMPSLTSYDCLQSKGDDGMQHPMFCDRVEDGMSHSTSFDCVFPNGYDGMLRSKSSDHVFCPMSMMACYVQSHPTMCAAQGPYGHATYDVIRSCVLSKGNDNMPRPTSSIVYSFKGR